MSMTAHAERNASSPYKDEMATFLDPEHNRMPALATPATILPEANAPAFYFHSIFTYATKPYDTPITQVTNADLPEFFAMLESLSQQLDITPPLVFLARDTQGHVDIKFSTLNKASAILIHPATLSILSPRILNRYLEQALMRIRETLRQHTVAQEAHDRKNRNYTIAAAAVATLLTVGAGWFAKRRATAASANTSNAADKSNTDAQDASPWKSGGIAAAATGLITSWLAHYILSKKLKRRMDSYTFQRISSFHDKQEAREEIYPGTSPVSVINPLYDATPEDVLDAISKAQYYLIKRNDEFESMHAADVDEKLGLTHSFDDQRNDQP